MSVVSSKALALGTMRSVMRELFEYGKVRAAQVGADPTGMAEDLVNAHNTSGQAHSEIRTAVSAHTANQTVAFK